MKPQWVVTVASVGALGGLLLGAGLPVLGEPHPVEPIKVIVPATDERPRAADDDSDGAADDDSDGAPQRNPVNGGGDDDTAADNGDDHDDDGAD